MTMGLRPALLFGQRECPSSSIMLLTRTLINSRHLSSLNKPRTQHSSRLQISVMASPAKIQLYSLATPNGQKISVALEELGVPYDTHVIDIRKGDQFSDEFKRVNPNSKIPAIVDPDGPGGKPLALFESGAILLYLAEKTGKLLPADPGAKWETCSWLVWALAGPGPMFGQFGHFTVYAPEKVPYAVERYTKEAQRLLGVLEGRLKAVGGGPYIMGQDYTIADIACFPWVNALSTFYKADDTLQLANFPTVKEWVARCMERPASKVGTKVAPFPDN